MSDLPILIATDLDGTLVRSDNTVSERSHHMLKQLSALGVTIVGITGRGPRLRELCRVDIPSADFLVMSQGGFIYECSPDGTDIMLRATLMPGRQASEVLRILEAELGPLTVIVENDPGEDAPLAGDFVDDWPWPVPILAMRREHALSGDVVKTFIRSDTVPALELLRRAQQIVPADLATLTEPGTGFVEICPPGINKGAGLSFVCDRIEVPASRTLAFGDAHNDLPMFAWAGHTVAMGNAHPQVKAVADELTDSNDDDGVAKYLQNRFAL